jgi:hypothetical protein
MLTTIWDEQTGKLITGYVMPYSEYAISLVDEDGNVLGVFDKTILPK